MNEFGHRIALVRRHRAMSIAELAVRARMTWNALIAIERNQRFPSLSEIERLLHALDIEWSALNRLSVDI